MHYLAVADTDIGISRKTNQDSILIKHGTCEKGEVLLAIVCDGMGGLEKGELASAAVVKEFSRWFDEELPFELEHINMQVIGDKWSFLLKDSNVKIAKYGQKTGTRLGTTFTGILFVGDEYVAVHVGDSRLYYLGSSLKQLTHDHTFVAREVGRGTLTVEQARTDKRRNMLFQCVGASEKIEPEVFAGRVETGAYVLCSDGFRHEISGDEIFEFLNGRSLKNRDAMQKNIRYLIEQVKKRQEQDNISAIVIRVS